VLASASGSGKTTFGRMLSQRLGVPFVELDALNHVGPDWNEATPEELRAKVTPIVDTDSWVIDGAYRSKLGDLILEAPTSSSGSTRRCASGFRGSSAERSAAWPVARSSGAGTARR
jgi:adenylate kinase family enzyme